MDSSVLLGLTTFAYLLAAILYVAVFVFKAHNKTLGIVATISVVVAFTINTAGILLRWYESIQMDIGYHAPFSNMYESLVFFAWSIGIFYIMLEWKFKTRALGAFAVPFAAMSMLLAEMKSPYIKPLIPALQSNWLIAHVITCFIGYAAFAIAFGLGITYLIKLSKENAGTITEGSLLSNIPSLKVFDDVIHKTMAIGFLWFTAGIIAGSVWANSAWGTYWSWDPKETWSLITWFVYAIALHGRFARGWEGKRIAWLAILGFACTMFTYYGVNYLLFGLHSYA